VPQIVRMPPFQIEDMVGSKERVVAGNEEVSSWR
jgi:hypothetical protein